MTRQSESRGLSSEPRLSPSSGAATRRREAGMTLVEILVVVTIIGLIATVIAVNVFGRLGSAQRQLAKTGVEQLTQAVDLFKMDNGRVPESLEELLNPPQGRQKYIKSRENLMDPWKQPYQYRTLENGDVEILSYGPDRQAGGTGDAADISLGAEGEESPR